MLIFNSKSANSKIINKYFIDMEKIVKLYQEYEIECFLADKEKLINQVIKDYIKKKKKQKTL